MSESETKKIIENVLYTQLTIHIPQFYASGYDSRLHLTYLHVRRMKSSLKTIKEMSWSISSKVYNKKGANKKFNS